MTGPLRMADLAAWRAWLEANHSTVGEVWLVFPRGTKAGSVSTGDALDEALCWGWIDSLVKRLDESTYARKFTPRADARTWSAANVRRMEALRKLKRVQPAGLAVYAPGPRPRRVRRTAADVPRELADALSKNARARRFFEALAPSYRRTYLGWVSAAKRAGTRARRAGEAVRLLARGVKSLLK